MTSPALYAIKELLSSPPLEQTITVQGWARTRRDSKAGISFIQLSDGSCQSTLQLVAPSALANYQDEILSITAGTALRATGQLVPLKGRNQSFELQVSTLEIIGQVLAPESYPIQPKRHTLEFLRDVAHLRPRTNTIAAAMRIRHAVSQAIHQFFHKAGFFWLHTPIITASDCEGAGEQFRISTLDLMNLPHNEQGQIDFTQDFFGKETFLTVSGQLNAEAYCLALSKVYTFGPTFRAENSNTSRHLAEFWMVEPEVAFADIFDNIKLASLLLNHVVRTVLNERQDDLEFCAERIDKDCINRLQALLQKPLETVTYTDAITQLQAAKKHFEFPVSWGIDLQSEHERFLAEAIYQGPVAIIDYPKDIKAFYMRANDDGKTVAAMDIIVPGMGEIIGGSQREERLEKLDQRLEEMQLNLKDYSWYRDLRAYGSVPHAGFGLGLERLISYITGLSNVRDVIAFPRTPNSANF